MKLPDPVKGSELLVFWQASVENWWRSAWQRRSGKPVSRVGWETGKSGGRRRAPLGGGSYLTVFVVYCGSLAGEILQPLGYETDVLAAKRDSYVISQVIEKTHTYPVVMPSEGELLEVIFLAGKIASVPAMKNGSGLIWTADKTVLELVAARSGNLFAEVGYCRDFRRKAGNTSLYPWLFSFFGAAPVFCRMSTLPVD